MSVSRPALALGGAAAMATWSLAGPALAGGPHGDATTDNGRHLGQAKHATPAPAASSAPGATATNGKAGHGRGPSTAHGHAAAHGATPHGAGAAHGGRGTAGGTAHATESPATTPSQRPTPRPASAGSGSRPGSSGDPSGNNGTVKIDRLGDVDRIPNNVPHPGCTFQVEWFGFDGGPDVISTVSFSPQAPTRDAGITVDGPLSVPVGGDAASGAGTASGLDAVQAYTLSFTGTPAAQGYHVRLTVHTPRSRGNDTKTKVFWVEPCAATSPALAAAPGTTPAPAFAGATGLTGLTGAPGAPGLTGTDGSDGTDGTDGREASSVFASADAAQTGDASRSSGPADRAGSSAAVPLAVDAGEHASALSRWSRSPFGVALVVVGLALAGAVAGLRLRGRA